MRRLYLLLIGLGILAFLAVSILLARVWNADGNEHSDITALVEAEARGDAAGMAGDLLHCEASAGCTARARVLSEQLRRSGKVAILELQPSTGFTLKGSTGVARVAWNTPVSPRPVVQCIRVHRAGNVLQGFDVQLLRISTRIPGGNDCPARF